MTDPTAEPSQRAEYREQLAQAILAWFHDGAKTEWPGEIDAYRSLAKSLVAVRDTAMEQLRADFQAVDESNLADAQAVANENERLRVELAGLRERAVVLPDDWRRQLANEVSDGWLSRIVALVESWFPAPEPEDIADEVNGR